MICECWVFPNFPKRNSSHVNYGMMAIFYASVNSTGWNTKYRFSGIRISSVCSNNECECICVDVRLSIATFEACVKWNNKKVELFLNNKMLFTSSLPLYWNYSSTPPHSSIHRWIAERKWWRGILRSLRSIERRLKSDVPKRALRRSDAHTPHITMIGETTKIFNSKTCKKWRKPAASHLFCICGVRTIRLHQYKYPDEFLGKNTQSDNRNIENEILDTRLGRRMHWSNGLDRRRHRRSGLS